MQDFFPLLREQQGAQIGIATEKKYLAIIRRMEKARKDPVVWLSQQSAKLDGTKSKAHRTTIGVLRSAITYYLRWKHHEATEELLDSHEATALFSPLLTRTSFGVKGENRSALSTDQYLAYTKTVKDLAGVPDQIKVVLLLLPHTGLRISEACNLKGCDVVDTLGAWTLHVLGKGNKPRLVPLSEDAIDLIEPYVEAAGEDDFLFENPCLGLPGSTRLELSPAQVRAVVRDQLQTEDGLESVVPHVLRHQFATMTVKANINVFTAMAVLGHSDLTTMQRYAHPDEEMKREVVNVVSEALDNLGRKQETAAQRRRRQLKGRE